jgi:endonuclease-3
MGRLSAQCTDARVNIVCEELFRRFPDMESMAEAPVGEIERLVYSCGFYGNSRVKGGFWNTSSAVLNLT